MYRLLCMCIFFFFKQKTAYEMRISDWSSDVCSSDLSSIKNWIQHFLPLHGDHVYPSAAPKAIARGNAPCARLAGIFGIGSIARDHHHGGSVIFLVEQVPDKHAEVQSRDRKSTRLNSSH